MHAQLRELLTNYGPVAGIWFDPIMGYYARPDLFPIHETYAMIRQLQPQTLICFKQGATGTEDFAAPERHGYSLAQRCREMIGEAAAEVAQAPGTATRTSTTRSATRSSPARGGIAGTTTRNTTRRTRCSRCWTPPQTSAATCC